MPNSKLIETLRLENVLYRDDSGNADEVTMFRVETYGDDAGTIDVVLRVESYSSGEEKHTVNMYLPIPVAHRLSGLLAETALEAAHEQGANGRPLDGSE